MLKQSLSSLTVGERLLWAGSSLGIVVAFFLFDPDGLLTLIASLVGTASLIFSAKGNPLGQALMLLFSLLYGVISYSFSYYGEMITYLGMTMPMAVQPAKTGRRHASAGFFLKLYPEKAAHQGVTAQVCPSAS